MTRPFATLLALCALHGNAQAFEAPASPRTPSAIAASGTVQLAFSPEDDAAGLIVKAIRDARKQVLVQAYSFTHRNIARALIEAHNRGLDVEVIADQEQILRMERGMIPEIAAAGVRTLTDAAHDGAHNKIILIDPETPFAVVITGSYNFTQAAQHRNAENLLLFRGNPQLTRAYLDNWRRHREHASPLANTDPR